MGLNGHNYGLSQYSLPRQSAASRSWPGLIFDFYFGQNSEIILDSGGYYEQVSFQSLKAIFKPASPLPRSDFTTSR